MHCNKINVDSSIIHKDKVDFSLPMGCEVYAEVDVYLLTVMCFPRFIFD